MLVASLLLIPFASAFGCSDPRFKQKQSQRDDQMRSLVTEQAKRAWERENRLSEFHSFHQKRSKTHAEHLQQSWNLIEQRYAKRLKAWSEQAPRRREFTQRVLKGKPQEIDDTWAKMIY